MPTQQTHRPGIPQPRPSPTFAVQPGETDQSRPASSAAIISTTGHNPAITTTTANAHALPSRASPHHASSRAANPVLAGKTASNAPTSNEQHDLAPVLEHALAPSNAIHAEEDVTFDAKATLPQSMCLQLLMEGHIQSYNEFFHLTHERHHDESDKVLYKEKPILPNETEERSKMLEVMDEDGWSQRALYSGDELTVLKKCLMTCEEAQLRQDKSVLYQAQRDLAKVYQQLQHYAPAALHFEEAVETAASALDAGRQIESRNLLGQVKEIVGDKTKAMQLFLASRQIAKTESLKDAEMVSTQKLVQARIRLAQSLDHEGRRDEAIQHYMETLQLIQETNPSDITTTSEIHYRLGEVYQHLGDTATAVKYLQLYLDNCRLLNDTKLEGLAQSAMAECYASGGNHATAIQHLKIYAQLAEESNDPAALATAYHKLGHIYQSTGEYNKALECFERVYATASQYHLKQTQHEQELQQHEKVHSHPTGDNTDEVRHLDITAARVQLGIARGNAQLDWWLRVVSQTNPKAIQEVLHWKAHHVLPSTAA